MSDHANERFGGGPYAPGEREKLREGNRQRLAEVVERITTDQPVTAPDATGAATPAQQARDEQAYWRLVCSVLGEGWRPYGWNYKHDASLVDEHDRRHEVDGRVAARLLALADQRDEAVRKAVEAERDDWQQRESACCPEDVGFEEYIAVRANQLTVKWLDAVRDCDHLRGRVQRLEGALGDLASVIDAAGLLNLSNGVQLGPTVWYVKASDAMEAARAALADAAGGDTPHNQSPTGPSPAVISAPPSDEDNHVHWWEYGEDGDGAWEACDCGAVRAPGGEGGKP